MRNGKPLPKKWELRRLGDCGQWVSGGTPRKSEPTYWGGDIPWFSAKSLKSFDLETSDDCVTTEGSQDGTTLVPSGTILFVVRGMSLANEFRLGITSRESTLNQDLRGVITTDDVDPRYLGRFLKHTNIVMCEIDNASHGTKRIQSDKLKEVEIPLPPLSEQKRIADILDKADVIRRKRVQSIAEICAVPGSLYAEMFGTPSHNTKGYSLVSVRELVSEVKYGTSSKAGTNGEFPILRMNNVTYEGDCDFSDLKYIDIPKEDRAKYLVRRGDLLFNRTNSRDLVGKTAVYQEEREMAYAGYLVRARTNDEAFPEYIAGYLNSPHGKATLRHMCKSIVGMANINAQEFQDIAILKPPIEAQQEYVKVLDAVRARKRSIQAAADESDDLFNSLVQRAFKGEL
ncbi:MAG TPA: restriction endonuclease [Planctomycetaceae bacterium]|nr:restriction endonuclease [Planctomycetaceae bacterium]